MNHPSSKKRVYTISWTPRLNILIVLVLAGSALVGWRMFAKSVIQHPLYAAQAENQYEISKDLPSRRGTIYAQDFEADSTVPIAATEEVFDISVVPRNVKDVDEASSVLSELFGLDSDEVASSIDSDKLYHPPLVRGVSRDQRDQVIERGFAGLLVERRHQRSYPEDQTGAHILGFVNRDGQGNYGVEGYYDEELRGEAGTVIGQKDTLGRIIDTVAQVEPEDGVDIELTIDHNVQFALEDMLYKAVERYGASAGQVVLINPTNGEILAMGSTPSFDPNKYNEYTAEQARLFTNPAVSSIYEPGSIFKPLVMASAIDLGKLEPDTKETFGKQVTVQGYDIHTAEDKAFGEETMTQVLENSDNVGMVWVAGQMSNEELYNKLDAFGIGHKTGVDVSGETTGELRDLGLWREIHRATVAFGQGVSVTPLQVMRAWSAILNGGSLVTPHVVKQLVGDNGVTVAADAPLKPGVISQETSDKLRTMLESVVVHGHGKKAQVPGYRIGGKTGTAQIPDPVGGYYEDKFVHSFTGFFPVDDPQFLLLVKLDRLSGAEFSASTAAPTFQKMASYILGYYRIPPSGESQ